MQTGFYGFIDKSTIPKFSKKYRERFNLIIQRVKLVRTNHYLKTFFEHTLLSKIVNLLMILGAIDLLLSSHTENNTIQKLPNALILQ